MTERVDISILRHEQPDEAAWKHIRRFVERWNQEAEYRFVDVLGHIWKIQLPDVEDPACRQLKTELDRLRDEHGVRYHRSTWAQYEEADFEGADFVYILGVGLEEEEPNAFIVNEEEALASPEPCAVCGWEDALNRQQVGPFRVREKMLFEPAYEGEPPPDGGWDFINTPNGHLLISRRCLQVMEDLGARGFSIAEVQNHPSRTVSEQVFHLLADTVVTEPCYKHTAVEAPCVCAACGTFYAPMKGPLFVRDDLVGDLDVFAMHPSQGARLYVSQDLYAAFLEADLNGLFPQAPAYLCVHDD